jgi:hypothetical protein
MAFTLKDLTTLGLAATTAAWLAYHWTDAKKAVTGFVNHQVIEFERGQRIGRTAAGKLWGKSPADGP